MTLFAVLAAEGAYQLGIAEYVTPHGFVHFRLGLARWQAKRVIQGIKIEYVMMFWTWWGTRTAVANRLKACDALQDPIGQLAIFGHSLL